MFIKYFLISIFLDEIMSIFCIYGDKYPDLGEYSELSLHIFYS